MQSWLSRARPGLPRPAGLLLLAVSVSLLLPFSRSCGIVHYGPQDGVKVLDANTLKNFILYSRSAWAVQFYANWCDDSVDFVPVWLDLAKEVIDWWPAVKLAVVDCGDMANEKICADNEIVDYPIVKFFKPFSKYYGEGEKVNVTELSPQSLKKEIIALVAKHEKAYWSPDAPILTPLSASDDLQTQGNKVFLIFEDESSTLGSEVILNMAQFQNITVRRVLKKDEKLASACAVTSYPSLFQFHDQNSCVFLLSDASVSGYAKALQKLPGVNKKIVVPEQPVIKPEAKPTTIWKAADKSDYKADLESSVFCTLRRTEMHFTYLDEEPLAVLKQFFTLLAEYFPEDSIINDDLHNLSDWLSVRSNVSRNELTEVLKPIKEAVNGCQSDIRTWMVCGESSPQLRGFPCSVWLLFHYMTVQEGRSGNKEITQSKSLSTMREFMKYFFGCPKCSKRFEDMARDSMDSVKSTDEAILWLWRIRNAYIVSLQNDGRSSQELPKIQWPSHDECEQCFKSNGEVDEPVVLKYIKDFFSLKLLGK
ncbi:sulfhydryl oxidase 1-like [Varanus komodoensis]|uniref:sulfhydryl oxidase 1-like n=1 Tax=Varanus komodoensis TaxID=61221 RepID=UPI001CF7E501|nr:sulfhydryl oxidase 1-like [Varanus komodoensis]